MKRRQGLFAAALCLMIIAGCADRYRNRPPLDVPEQEVNEHQGNLDVIQPSAYRNVNGLAPEPGTSVSIIGRGSSSAYWTEVRKGAQDAVDALNEQLGYEGDQKIQMTYSAPAAEDDVDDQVNILDEELDRYPSAVGIAAVDADACEVQFDLALENGIPVVAFDSGTVYPNIACMVDTDNVEAASQAAGKLCASIGDAGEILVLVHDSHSTSAALREQGFAETIQEKYPDVQIVETYHLDELGTMAQTIAAEQAVAGETGEDTPQQEPAEETDETAAEEITQEDVLRYLLEKYPNVKGIYATNETAARLAVGAAEELGRSGIRIVSFDGGEEQLELLREGKLEGLIVQNPYGIGYATVVACTRAALGQGNEAQVDTGYTWVTADNLEDEAIQRVLY